MDSGANPLKLRLFGGFELRSTQGADAAPLNVLASTPANANPDGSEETTRAASTLSVKLLRFTEIVLVTLET